MKFEETITKTEGKDKYTNNIETTQITKNGKQILPYCILAVQNTTVTIKQGNMITTKSIHEQNLQEIIEILTTQEKPKKEKKTSKTTNKETKKQQKNNKETTEQSDKK